MATLLKEINVGYATGNWYLRLYEDSISQSIDGNYTTVNLRLTLRADRSTWVSFDNRDAWIHGTHFTPAYRHDNPEHNIGTTSIRINHNADGTGSYSVEFGISTSYALNGSGSGGRTLPTIPRASGFANVSGGTLGQPITVGISRASSNFTHTVKYQFGNIVREYTNQTTSCTFTPPMSDASQIPNALSGICTMTLYTYNGGTLIGTKSMTLSIRIDPTQCAPSFDRISVTRVDNGVPPEWGIYVQGKSKAIVKIEGATAKYGASIASYQISVEGFNGGNGLTAGPFRSGTISIKASVVDSRNISTNQITQIVVYENVPPALSVKAERCNSAGTPSNNGTYIKVTPTYSCASVNGKNYISSKNFKINGTSYQNTTGASGASFILGNNDIAVSKAYVVSGIVTDSLGQSSSTIEVNIPTSSVPIHVRDNQDGISFGKYSEKKNSLESAWDIYIKNNRVIPMSMTGGYWGFSDISDYLRTPIKGLIPYKSGANGNIGTEYWRFDFGYFVSLNVSLRGFFGGYINNKYALSTASLICRDWIRTTGNTGWHNETYGGGIYMVDNTYVRVYNDKRFKINNRCDATSYWITYVPSRTPGYAVSGGDRGIDQNAISEITLVKSSSPYLQIITPTGGGTIAWGVGVWASDIKMKKNIKEIPVKQERKKSRSTSYGTYINALSIVNSLKHYCFDWSDLGGHINLGYIADYLQEIYPDAVFEVGDEETGKTKNISPSAMIPLITLAMQQQNDLIEEQCLKIKSLEERIEKLEKLMGEAI